MTSVPVRQVPTISTVKSAASGPVGRVAAVRDTVAGVRFKYEEHRVAVQFWAVVSLLLLAVALWLAHFWQVTVTLLALWLVMVVWAWRQKHSDAVAAAMDAGEPFEYRWYYPRRWLGRMLLGPVGVLTILTYAWAHYAVKWPLCELFSICSAFGIVLVLAVMERPEEVSTSRWTEESLRDAFVAAGAVKGGFTRLGPPQTDEHGEWQTLKLAPGEVWSDVAKNLPALASALDVEEDLLTVEHAGGPPNTVKVRITERGAPLAQEVTVSALVDVLRTHWRDPIRIGVDNEGKPVHLLTAEHNTLIAGVMGYGKTVSARMPLGHFLLDPVTSLYVADGKSSKRDYGAVAPSCERFVWGTDEDAPEQMLSMLRGVLNVVRDRNANDYDGAEWPGLLLLLEEFQDIRAGAEKAEREEIDKTLGRIVRMGRAVSVHTLVSTQRPSVEDLPSGTRNLIDQRLALVLRNGQDASLVLGHTPPKHLPTPSRKGEAIFADPATDRAVQLDYIDGQAWRTICARAAALRKPAVDLDKPKQESITVAAAPVVPTLLGAVTQVLQVGEVQSASLFEQVAEMLPAELVPPDASALGRRLGKHPQFASRRTATGTRWRLVAATQGAAVASGEPVLSVNGGQSVDLSASTGPAVGAGVRR